MRNNKFIKRYLIALIGIAVSAIGWLGLSDLLFAFGIPFASWVPKATPMALPTVSAFILTGTGFILIACSDQFWKHND